MSQAKAYDVYHSLRVLRERGWRVAVHNDYMEGSQLRTFWLFTWSKGPYFVKGESTEDYYALNQCLTRADEVETLVREREKKTARQP